MIKFFSYLNDILQLQNQRSTRPLVQIQELTKNSKL